MLALEQDGRSRTLHRILQFPWENFTKGPAGQKQDHIPFVLRRLKGTTTCLHMFLVRQHSISVIQNTKDLRYVMESIPPLSSHCTRRLGDMLGQHQKPHDLVTPYQAAHLFSPQRYWAARICLISGLVL